MFEKLRNKEPKCIKEVPEILMLEFPGRRHFGSRYDRAPSSIFQKVTIEQPFIIKWSPQDKFLVALTPPTEKIFNLKKNSYQWDNIYITIHNYLCEQQGKTWHSH